MGFSEGILNYGTVEDHLVAVTRCCPHPVISDLGLNGQKWWLNNVQKNIVSVGLNPLNISFL